MSQSPGNKAAQEQVGRVLGGTYTLARLLGVGGMGAVYQATHAGTGKRVAVKLLAPHLSRDLKLVARFRREAVAASRLAHENCVHVHDFGEDADGTFYIAMEYVDGRGLADELRASGPMPPDRVARIGVQLFRALDAAHAAGVLHRDLKPQNVMLMQKPNRPDIVKVVDFGIAKLTTNDVGNQPALTVPGTIFGTPEYMSPEQARGEPLDARSDVYSAAVVLWHLLLGRSPFRGTSVRDTLLKVFAEEAPSPSRVGPIAVEPSGVELILRKALVKNRDERWPDAASLADALAPFAGVDVVGFSRVLPGLPVDGSPPPETLDALAPTPASPPSTSPGRESPGDDDGGPASVTLPLVEAAAVVSAAAASSGARATRPPDDAGGAHDSNSFPATRYVASTFALPSGLPSGLSSGLPSGLSSPSAAVPSVEASSEQRRDTPARATKVVTVALVRPGASGGAQGSPEPFVGSSGRKPRISRAALVVIICGLVVLSGLAIVALVAATRPLTPGADDRGRGRADGSSYRGG